MNTVQINRRLSHVKDFCGTYPRNKIPEQWQKPIGIIINTDVAGNPGQHWVAVYIDKDGNGEYFDSFGLPPLFKEIVKFLNTYSFRWQYNPYKLQGDASRTCGKYCILFIELKSLGMSFTDILSLFVKSSKCNDELINNYVS